MRSDADYQRNRGSLLRDVLEHVIDFHRERM